MTCGSTCGAVAPVLGLVMTIGASLGCEAHDHPHGEGEDHAHDDHGDHEGQGEEGHGGAHAHGGGEAIGVTKWTDELELFAEHPPAVAGEEMAFLAHLTVLDGFEPLEEATVTLVLDGPARVEGSVAEMLRSGIFQPAVVPKKPGTYEARLEVTGPVVRDTIDGFSIEVYPSRDAAREAASPEQGEDVGQISLLKEQQWKVPFGTAFARERTIVPTVGVAGEVTTPPGGRAQVGAPTAGRIVAPRGGLVRPGQPIRAGTSLATIAPSPSSPEGAARASLAVAEARARLSSAQAAVERNERLLEAEAIPERALQEARRELEVAEEAVQAARQAKQLYEGASSGRGGGTWRVKAPIDGAVVEVRATPGESVSAGQLLFRIVDRSELWLQAEVPEQQASRLRTDLDATYRVTGSEQWRTLRVTGDDPDASIVHVDPTVDPKSRTVAVIYSLADPDPHLRIGGLVYLELPAGEPTTSVVVPRSAVLERDGAHTVYVQVSGESFVERTVEIGPRAGAYVAVRQGVEAGDRVVTEGAHLVRLASRTPAGADHGHVH